MTTMGDLISSLFATFERRYRDEELAAVATQVALDDLLRDQKRARRRRTARPYARRG